MKNLINRKLPFITKKPTQTVPISIVKKSEYKAWLKKQSKQFKAVIEQTGFEDGKKKTLLAYNKDGILKNVYALCEKNVGLYDLAQTATDLKNQLSENTLKKIRFELKTSKLSGDDINAALTGWGLVSYEFGTYKSKDNKPAPIILWPAKANKKRVEASIKSMLLLRDLINIPANDLGPAELEKTAKAIAKDFKAKVSTTTDKKLLEKNFPLIYTVGNAASKNKRPRLIDLTWGKKTHPKVTLVGKGVTFDTGGLNLKPTQYMALMKKDMGGAAHALALGYLIMALNLPIQLRVLVAAVENSVSSEAFRPGDIFKSRKGHFVENTNTDAEGRLILADALTYACESNPDLVIDFATLTGSARAALGQEIPAMFSSNDKTAQELQKLSFDVNDPLWAMPLHTAYNKHIENSNGDLINSASLPGDLIYSALFLNKFVADKQDWIHLDQFVWESTGKPGRTKGGTDMGLRAILALLEKRYG